MEFDNYGNLEEQADAEASVKNNKYMMVSMPRFQMAKVLARHANGRGNAQTRRDGHFERSTTALCYSYSHVKNYGFEF